jgi:hypothetical protein
MQGMPSFRLWQVARIDLDCCPKLLVARITMFYQGKWQPYKRACYGWLWDTDIMSQLGGSLAAQGPIRFNENIRGVSNLKIWDNLLFKPKACGWNQLKNPLPKLGDYLTMDRWLMAPSLQKAANSENDYKLTRSWRRLTMTISNSSHLQGIRIGQISICE